jgi:hypothetical protein
MSQRAPVDGAEDATAAPAADAAPERPAGFTDLSDMLPGS